MPPRQISELKPQVDAIRTRLAADPAAMLAAISVLYKQHGVALFDRSSLLGMLIQLPMFGLLYQAVSNAGAGKGGFLWMKSLASPDAVLTAIVLLLNAVSAYYFPSAAGGVPALMIVVQVAVTAFVMWKLSAAMGLYWAASASLNTVQTLMLHREQRRSAAGTAMPG